MKQLAKTGKNEKEDEAVQTEPNIKLETDHEEDWKSRKHSQQGLRIPDGIH